MDRRWVANQYRITDLKEIPFVQAVECECFVGLASSLRAAAPGPVTPHTHVRPARTDVIPPLSERGLVCQPAWWRPQPTHPPALLPLSPDDNPPEMEPCALSVLNPWGTFPVLAVTYQREWIDVVMVLGAVEPALPLEDEYQYEVSRQVGRVSRLHSSRGESPFRGGLSWKGQGRAFGLPRVGQEWHRPLRPE